MAVRRWIGLLMAVALVLCIPAFTQNQPEGRIAGVVHDSSGAVVAGANITITNQGTNAKFTATTSADGGFLVPTVPVGQYRVEVAAQGFSTAVYTDVAVEPAKTYSLTATLKVGAATETVEVVAGQDLVNTATSEVSNTITVNQIQNLPLLGRDIITLARSQAGVVGNNGTRANTSINGQRPSWTQATLDGISIQDLFIRTNAVDYIPNRPTTDTVDSFTVVTGAQGADASMGASAVRMVTPSGTNNFHGAAWDYNRNSKFSANSWFNGYNHVPKAFRNRNEYGAKLLGPIVKNKLFFNFYYVAIKDRQSATRNLTIPQNDDMLQGWYRYIDSAGAVQRVNVLTGAGMAGTPPTSIGVDPKVQSLVLSQIKPAALINNPIDATVPNTGVYSYSARNNYNRDNLGGKVDFELSAKHHFDGTFSYMHEYTDRGEYSVYNQIPLVYNDSHPKLASIGWRYTITDHLINTLRAGFNMTDAPFQDDYHPDMFVTYGTTCCGIPFLTDPQVTALGYQGRQSNSYQANDSGTWVHGKHNVSFGGSLQAYRVRSWNMGTPGSNIMPTYYTGLNGAPADMRISIANLPNTTDQAKVTEAENLRAFLGGIVQYDSQGFNATSRTSGYVNGAGSVRHLPLNDLAFYGQDQFRLLPNLTLTLGVKWEYLSPYQESEGLALGPVYSNPNDPVGSLLTMPNTGQINFLDKAWKSQYGNFGPSIGFAWDPFKNGRTSVRGGYTLAFVNDDVYRFSGNAADGNSGLSTTPTPSSYLYGSLSSPPAINAPTYAMPLTLTQLKAISPTNVIWALDPNAKVPKVHEVYFGIQRELPGQMSMEVRYVGTFGRDLLRGVDWNQSKAGTDPAFLADFARARWNYYNCKVTIGTKTYNNPNATPTDCAVAQPLTVIPNLVGATTPGPGATLALLDPRNGTGMGYITRNEAAGLAANMLGAPLTYTNAFATFLPNPNIYALDYGTNAGFSSYHGFQSELRRRFANGLQFEANYVWSKNLSNSPADTGQTRFDPFLDNNRPWLAKARSNYDLRHQFKANFVYDLPFGKGRTFLGSPNKYLDKVIGGWQLSAIYNWQTGAPFSILAAGSGTATRYTFNRRNATQTAVSTIPQSQIKQYFGVTFCPDAGPAVCGQTTTGATRTGIFYISPLLTDPANGGRAVAPDNLNNTTDGKFNQIFFNPTAGNIGNIGLLMFDGPAYQNTDLGLMKEFKVTERINTKFRADFFNMPNHPQFYFGDAEINSTSFGKITSTNSAARVIQFSLRVEF